MNYLELIDFLMEEYGMDEGAACRIADMELNDDYEPDDYL